MAHNRHACARRIALDALKQHPNRVQRPEDAEVIFVDDWCLLARTMADVHARDHL